MTTADKTAGLPGSPPAPVSLLHPILAGILAGIVGFASSFAVVLAGYAAMGATLAEAASGLMVMTAVKGLVGIGLSLRNRQPISIAWSTPGAALLAATPMLAGGYNEAIGAYVVASLLIVLAGLWGAFGRAVSSIPMSLAAAMLAGVLLDLCLAPVKAVATLPGLALPIVVAWALAWRFTRLWATPIALAVTGIVVALRTSIPAGAFDHIVAMPIFHIPHFEPGSALSLGLPLFIVTMASQNVPGLAVLRVNGYEPRVAPIFITTGLASTVIALFGGHQINLAAITAALCAGPDAHPDPAKRWWAAAAAGASYVLFGLGAGFAVAFAAAMPPMIIQTVAGLALLGSFGGALATALAKEDERIPAILTFAVAGSGVTGMGLKFFGIGPAFWGLVAGGLMLALARAKR